MVRKQTRRALKKRLFLAVCLICSASGQAQEKPAKTPEQPIKIAPLVAIPQRSISLSQQFFIYYPDRILRSGVARKVEEVKQNWLRVTGLKDEWKTPIVVQLHALRPPRAPRVQTMLFVADGEQLKVQIDVFDLSALKSSDFDLEVFRALCLEYEYREVPLKSGKAYTQPPNWLLEGLYQDSLAQDEGLPPSLFDKLIQNGPPPKLGAFLKQRSDNLDATSRAIYRAQAMTLLRALLKAPDGSKHLTEYLSSLPGTNNNDDDKLLEKFPLLAGQPANLSKLWTLALADATGSNRVKALGMSDTLKQLNLILEINLPKDPKKPDAPTVAGPEGLQPLSKTEPGRYMIRQKAEDLMRLEGRAHPMIQPIVAEYRLIATILGNKPKNLESRIHKNMELQQAVAKRVDQVEDYLNWFEATQLNTPSREFDAITMPDDSQINPPRSDAISRRMDDLEARGW